MRSRCAQCGDSIRRSQLTGQWTHIGPFLSATQPIHDPRPLVTNGWFDVEPDQGPTT